MRLRLGFLAGLATGYYLGAKAGRERYEQINRALEKIRRSEAFETATERAKEVVELGKDKAREAVHAGRTNGDMPHTPPADPYRPV